MPSIAVPSFKVLLEFAMHLLFLLQAARAGMKISLNRKSNHQKQIRLLTALHPVTIHKQKEFRNQGSSRKPSTSVPFCASACWWYCPPISRSPSSCGCAFFSQRTFLLQNIYFVYFYYLVRFSCKNKSFTSFCSFRILSTFARTVRNSRISFLAPLYSA